MFVFKSSFSPKNSKNVVKTPSFYWKILGLGLLFVALGALNTACSDSGEGFTSLKGGAGVPEAAQPEPSPQATPTPQVSPNQVLQVAGDGEGPTLAVAEGGSAGSSGVGLMDEGSTGGIHTNVHRDSDSSGAGEVINLLR